MSRAIEELTRLMSLFQDFSFLIRNYHQKLEAEAKEDHADDEGNTSKPFEETVRKRTPSAQRNGDMQAKQDDEEKEINGHVKMNNVEKVTGILITVIE